jgi:hypothetical protein
LVELKLSGMMSLESFLLPEVIAIARLAWGSQSLSLCCACKDLRHTAAFLGLCHLRRLDTVSPAIVADCLIYRMSVLRFSVVTLLEGKVQ